MNGSDPDAAFNTLEGYVYEGIWRDYNAHPFNQLKWTLSNTNAIFLFAFYTTLLTFTQPRAWEIWCFVIHNWLGRRISDGGSASRVSQGEATSDLIYFAGAWFRRAKNKRDTWLGHRRAGNTASEEPIMAGFIRSPLFVLAVIINAVIFIAMGIAIPYLISEGALGAPVVKSRSTDDCVKSIVYENLNSVVRTVAKVDAVFKHCLDTPHVGCDNKYSFTDPIIERRRVDSCPFADDICMKGVKPLEILLRNISAYDLGVISKHRILTDHKMTCVPVDTDPFLLHGVNQNETWLSIQHINFTKGDTIEVWRNLSLPLETRNGPNRLFPSENSGWIAAKRAATRKMVVLPPYFTKESDPSYQAVRHPSMHIKDGKAFMIFFRGGRTGYANPVDDAFLSAHNYFSAPGVGGLTQEAWLPDREATALGCIEYNRFCVPELDYCTPWGSGSTSTTHIANRLRHPLPGDPETDTTMIGDVFFLYSSLPHWLSTYQYLVSETEWLEELPLRSYMSLKGVVFLDDYKEQWVTEVDYWFQKAYLHGILYAQNSARFNLRDCSGRLEQMLIDDCSLCGRILFRDAEHTNVHWYGFLVTNILIVLIWIVSALARWHKVSGRGIRWGSRQLWRVVAWLKRTVRLVTLLWAGLLAVWINDRTAALRSRPPVLTPWSRGTSDVAGEALPARGSIELPRRVHLSEASQASGNDEVRSEEPPHPDDPLDYQSGRKQSSPAL